MTTGSTQLALLQIAAQCVVICDLHTWSDAESPAWRIFTGSQDDVGRALAGELDARGTGRIDDFGGVCETILCRDDVYLESPPRVKPGGSVFSFTPRKRLVSEGQDMARVSRAAGYDLLILTVQKHDKFGKVWVLSGLLRHLKREKLVYYEDTSTVVDEIKSSPEAQRVVAIHVQAPGFEEHVAKHADRIVTQAEYRGEVLSAGAP
jgi:hypothetical protein